MVVVFLLLGNSPASQFYTPTFRNTLFHLHRHIKMEKTECSETSAYKIHTPGNYPEENIQHTEHGESLKSRIFYGRSKRLNFHLKGDETCPKIRYFT